MEWGLSSTHKEVDGDEEVDDSCQAPGGRGSELGKKKKKNLGGDRKFRFRKIFECVPIRPGPTTEERG